MEFTSLPLSNEVQEGIRRAGFTECTMVQDRVLPVTLDGKDVMVQSKTGSGKTAVFLITILEKFIRSGKSSRAIVISPTRELAVQIEEDARLLSSGIEGYRIGCFYGGVGYSGQDKLIEEGLDLYVGTPGRLIDYAHSHKIDFRSFDIVVLDEADRMFDMGFYPDIQKMFAAMVTPQERQTMLFSATLSTSVRNLAWQYMNEAEEIEVQPEEITVKNITQELFHVSKSEKFGLLLSLLKKINPASCLIFTNTKDRAVEVSGRLNANGYKSLFLMGDMPQAKRLKTLDQMKEGKLSFLVATDVAARGLQIDDLELVVNYDIPEDYENYVHRIGRTARAGKSGKAITLACEEYIYGLEGIEEYIQMKIPVLWPDEVGLESVEDKSLLPNGNVRRYTYSNGKRQDGRKGLDKRPGKKGSSKTYKSNKSEAKPSKPYKEDRSSKTDFDKLSRMSLEERMEYYKKSYAPTAASAKATPSKGGKQERKQGPKPNKTGKPQSSTKKANVSYKESNRKRSTPATPVMREEQRVVIEVRKEEKKGFFKRLFSKLRGK